MNFRPCAIVPSRNHWRAVAGVVDRLCAAGLPVFVIDDGSEEPARTVLAGLADPRRGVTVFRFDENQGKGGAVRRGFLLAIEAGYTHAVQVDADGQHDPAALPALLDLARRRPDALVTGVPVYDSSIPKGRAIGRWITHVWVWIETLSLQIRDSMCGYRVYPLGPVEALLKSGETIGRRMDFDTEIMVRLFWRGTPVAELPVAVTYLPDNISNFDMLGDNWRITRMHTRLVFEMLLRLPSILGQRPKRIPSDRPTHWAGLAERGMYWGLRLSALACRLLGRKGALAFLSPVALYFYLTGEEQRRASRQFLGRAFQARGAPRQPGWLDGYRHFLSFTRRALDTFAAWTGAIGSRHVICATPAELATVAANPRGALFIVAHLGNADVSRAVMDEAMRKRLTILVHTRHAENYNRLLREFRPDAAVNTVQVTDIGPDTAIALQEKVERGEWIVIAGDRTPVGGGGRVSVAPFLGAPAPFNQGPYILASLLECPVYLLFCLRDGDTFRLWIEPFADRITLPRDKRAEALDSYVRQFARRLEEHTLRDPLQWYNFFDFWAVPNDLR